MKRFRVMAAALCAVVLLCGFSVPAYAYADGGEGADYGDPTMTEETPAPEPTIEPGEGFSEEGNLVTRDLLYDEHTNKQFITVQTSGGNTFYTIRHIIPWIVTMGSNTPPACTSPAPRSSWIARSCFSGCGTPSTPCRRSRAAGWTLI